jgi:hypothetical protein
MNEESKIAGIRSAGINYRSNPNTKKCSNVKMRFSYHAYLLHITVPTCMALKVRRARMEETKTVPPSVRAMSLPI